MLLNSQLKYFGASDLSNVDTWVNIYNPNDIGNLIADYSINSLKSAFQVLLSLPRIDRFHAPTGRIVHFVPRVEEYKLDISHEVFWNDPKVREVMEKYTGSSE